MTIIVVTQGRALRVLDLPFIRERRLPDWLRGSFPAYRIKDTQAHRHV